MAALLLLRVDGLEALNYADGMHAGDAWLNSQALALQPDSNALFTAMFTGVPGKPLLSIPQLPEVDQGVPVIADRTDRWWLSHLPQVIENGAIELVAQPVVRVQSRRVMHREVLVRVRDAHDLPVSAGVFLPLAGKLARLPAFERAVSETLLERVLARRREQRFAVNLSLGISAG